MGGGGLCKISSVKRVVLTLALLFTFLTPIQSAHSAYTPNPILHYDAGNSSSYSGSGNTWVDIGSLGKNATFVSTPGYSTNGGGILGFSSSNYATVGAMNPDYTKGFTATFYANFGSANNWERIIDFGNGQGSSNIIVARNGSTSALHIGLYSGASVLGYCNANSIILNGWNHYGVIADGTNCYFYRNGSLWSDVTRYDGSNTVVTAMTSVPPSVNRSTNYIGESSWSVDDFFAGGMGEISIYNRGLTANEIYENFLSESYICPVKDTFTSGNTRFVKFYGTLGCQWVTPDGVTSIDYLLVGGGGGGGGAVASASYFGGGGGGGGGSVLAATSVSIPNKSVFGIVVGLGGAGGSLGVAGGAGTSTNLSINGAPELTAAGGGGGTAGTATNVQSTLAGDGGSSGSNSGGANDWDGAGGGAGAGGVGSAGTDLPGQGGSGGNGGAGVQSSISNNATQWFGSGGGGGGVANTNDSLANQSNGFGGIGGNSTGGNGGVVSATKASAPEATNGALDSGSGGGGGGWNFNSTSNQRKGGNGANGVLFIKFTLAQASVTSISITSTSGSDLTYRSNETITVAVVFSQRVFVSGSPIIPIQGLSSKNLTYSSGLDTTTVLFTYRPTTGDLDANGIEISANTLALNGGTILDSSGYAVSILHGAITALASNAVDARLTAEASISLGSNLTFRRPGNITASITQGGRVTFYIDNKRIPQCMRVQTTFNGSNYLAVCNLVPSVRGLRTLKVDFILTGSNVVSATTTSNVFIQNRATTR